MTRSPNRAFLIWLSKEWFRFYGTCTEAVVHRGRAMLDHQVPAYLPDQHGTLVDGITRWSMIPKGAGWPSA